MAQPTAPERSVSFRPRALLSAVAVLFALAVVGYIFFVSRRIVAWSFVALFLTLAINPAVEWLHRHHVPKRGIAVSIVFLIALALFLALAAVVIPNLVTQVTDFINAAPKYTRDLIAGRGPLGGLETKYHVVERVQSAVKSNSSGGGGGGAKLATGAGIVVSAGRTVLETVAATITIIFLTFFMLLEGPGLVDRAAALLPDDTRPRWLQVGHDIYRTVGGYVTGNLLISLIAGIAYGVVLLILGVPYALALGFFVAILDLIPLAGATLAGIIVVLVALADSTTSAIIMAVFVCVYQLVENHVLQPIIYARTVQLSPLLVLLAILVGSSVLGILGALAAIPVASALQIVVRDQLAHRRRPATAVTPATDDVAVGAAT